MPNFNDNSTKNQCIVYQTERNDHKLIDFIVDTKDICDKHQHNRSNIGINSGGLNTTKSKNLIIVERKHFDDNVNDDYDSAGPTKQTDESSSTSHDDDEPSTSKVVEEQCRGRIT
ncbi:hypothetical protein BLA29_009492, partial [Euroglyphus maynei]